MSQATADIWTRASQQFQQVVRDVLPSIVQQTGTAHAITFSPQRLQQAQQEYLEALGALCGQGWQPQQPDPRFKSPAWRNHPFSAFAAALYQIQSRALLALADAVEADAKTAKRIRFAVEQWIAATAPSNFLAFNAEAQEKAIATQGESIARGVCP